MHECVLVFTFVNSPKGKRAIQLNEKSVEAIIQMSITESYFGCNKHRYNIPFTHLSDIKLECKNEFI